MLVGNRFAAYRVNRSLLRDTLPIFRRTDMADKGFLLVTMQPPPALEEEFNAWYDTEHLPERLAVPGFETALRFVCLDGHPRYLAMYDLANPEVLQTPEYLRVAFENSSPWTRRILQRVRVYRASGRQIYPGAAATGIASRIQLVRFRNAPMSAAEDIINGMRANFESYRETAQVRVLAYEDRGSADFLGFVEQHAPSGRALDLELFGTHAASIDLMNAYAPY
jgi:hypothetical protein